MTAFTAGDRVVLVDGRYATVIATGVDGSMVATIGGEVLGPVVDAGLSVAVDEDFDQEFRHRTEPGDPPA